MRPSSAIAAIMRSGNMPLAWVGSENGTARSLGGSPDVIQTPEIRLFTALSDGRLDGKGASEYQVDLSRGDLSRPACSHVKQVAKQAGDSVIPACGIFPGRFFVAIFEVVTQEVTCLRSSPPPAIVPKPGWCIPALCAHNSARRRKGCF